MEGTFLYSTFNCGSCGQPITPRYSSCIWATCSSCAKLNRKGGGLHDNEFPQEDLTPLQPGTRGKWEEKNFEVTGRLRFIFKDESYVNWWHLESGGITFGWIAEAYNDLCLMKSFSIGVSPSVIESTRLGDERRLSNYSFVLSSVSPAVEWSAAGELPELPPDKPFLWAAFERQAEKDNALDVHLFDHRNMSVFLGTMIEEETASLSNLRKL